MANRDLLKEAIADAKALKETAIANAKAALEEAFEPKIKSMLSAKLEEMEKEEMEEEIEEVVTNEAKEEIEEAKEDMDEGYGKKDMDEEVELDEMLAELEEGEDKEDMKEAEEMDETIDEAEEDDKDEDDAEEMEGEDEDEEIDLEDMSEEDLKKFIEDVIEDMVKAGELEAGEDFEDDVDVEVDADGEIEVEDDEMTSVDLAEGEDIDEGKKEDMEEGYGKDDMDEGKEELNEVGPEVALAAALGIPAAALATMGLQAAIDKAAAKGNKVAMALSKGMEKMGSVGKAGLSGDDGIKEELDELRAELHEVNLLNAKLLYANKIFRAKNLKEAQKVKVLEAFDKASNVNEVKLVFETLSSEVKETKTVVKENLGSASKPAGMAPTKAPIVEVDPQVARWQKLAGLR